MSAARKAQRRPKVRKAKPLDLDLDKLLNQVSRSRAMQKVARVADAFEIPLWVLFVPDLPKSILEKDSESLRAFVGHVFDYLTFETLRTAPEPVSPVIIAAVLGTLQRRLGGEFEQVRERAMARFKEARP